jgi:hypothetical protein
MAPVGSCTPGLWWLQHAWSGVHAHPCQDRLLQTASAVPECWLQSCAILYVWRHTRSAGRNAGRGCWLGGVAWCDASPSSS